MRRIGVTQRVETVASYQERRDCLDQNWFRFLLAAGFAPVPLGNAVAEPRADYLQALGLDGVVLSGGNDLAKLSGAANAAPERDRFEDALLAHCREQGLPVLGVCRGMQVLNVAHGGRLQSVAGHVATRHTVTAAGERFEVNSYHGYGIAEDGLGAGLEATAHGADGTVEALRSADGRCHGIMWHPEREQPFHERDLRLFRRALSGARR